MVVCLESELKNRGLGNFSEKVWRWFYGWLGIFRCLQLPKNETQNFTLLYIYGIRTTHTTLHSIYFADFQPLSCFTFAISETLRASVPKYAPTYACY